MNAAVSAFAPGFAERAGIERVVLVTHEPGALLLEPAYGLPELERDFPHVTFDVGDVVPDGAVTIAEAEWGGPAWSPYAWDAALGALAGRSAALAVVADPTSASLACTGAQVLTRYQRLCPRVNRASQTPAFRRALRAHRALHDLSKPLVRADYDHALDVWQWLLRLSPKASAPLQLAALFHDIERLYSEADVRSEQHARDYQAFKDAHARTGAVLTLCALTGLGLSDAELAGVEALIAMHELPSHEARAGEAADLADADALSFFTLNSPGFADYYGPQHTRMKVSYTLGRMTTRARRLLGRVKLRSDIAEHIRAARAASPSAPFCEVVA